jgi:hypothetical protein
VSDEAKLVRELTIKNEGLRLTITKLLDQVARLSDQRNRALACVRLDSLSAMHRLDLVAKTLSGVRAPRKVAAS